MARRTKEDAEKTRESLLDAAEAVFLRKGVAASTLEDIAKEAGVTRGAIYWHFENKIAIFRAMHDRVKSPMDVLFEELTAGPDPLSGLRTLCQHVLSRVVEDEHARNVFTILRLRADNMEDGQEIIAKRKEVIEKFIRVFKLVEKSGRLAPGMTPETAALGLHTVFSGLFWDYLTMPEIYPMSRMGPLLMDGYFEKITRA